MNKNAYSTIDLSARRSAQMGIKMNNVKKMIENIEEMRSIPKGEKFICLFSGGKDCGLALELALEQGAELYELVHCINCDTNEAAWHKQSQSLAIEQAKCMETSLNIVMAGPYQNRNKFIRELRRYAENGVRYIVCGDIKEGDQAMLEVAVSLAAGLIPKMPLWYREYDEIVQLQQEYNIESIITYIEDAAQLGVEWLGKPFLKEAYNAFQKCKIDPLGEDGEFHSTLIYSKSFKRRMKIVLGEKQDTGRGIKIPVLCCGERNGHDI